MNELHDFVMGIVREALAKALTTPSSGHHPGALRTEANDSIGGGESPRRLNTSGTSPLEGYNGRDI